MTVAVKAVTTRNVAVGVVSRHCATTEDLASTHWSSVRQQTVMLSGVERHDLIKAGLPTRIFRDALATFRVISVDRLMHAVGPGAKTRERRASSRLGLRHSDAIVALIDLTDLAQRALGTRNLAEQWLVQPAIALGGRSPLDLLGTTPGIESIKELLTRIEHGVYILCRHVPDSGAQSRNLGPDRLWAHNGQVQSRRIVQSGDGAYT